MYLAHLKKEWRIHTSCIQNMFKYLKYLIDWKGQTGKIPLPSESVCLNAINFKTWCIHLQHPKALNILVPRSPAISPIPAMNYRDGARKVIMATGIHHLASRWLLVKWWRGHGQPEHRALASWPRTRIWGRSCPITRDPLGECIKQNVRLSGNHTSLLHTFIQTSWEGGATVSLWRPGSGGGGRDSKSTRETKSQLEEASQPCLLGIILLPLPLKGYQTSTSHESQRVT